jgi:uncharacterized protein (TIGR04222 family)
VGLFGLPLAVTTWNPLDWTGPEFLGAYLILTAVAATVALLTKFMFVDENAEEGTKSPKPLDPYEAACLAEGPARAVQAAFAAMVQAGTLELFSEESTILGLFSRKTNMIRQGKPLALDAPPLERALFDAVSVPVKDLGPLNRAGMPIAQRINDELVERGLVQTGPPPMANVTSALIMATPLLLGGAKIAVGLSRGKPVEILIVLCVLTFAAALAFLLTRTRLSTAGQALLESLQAKHSTTRQLATSSATSIAPPDLAMAIGLFGVGMLAVGPLSNVHAMLPRNTGGGGCSSGGCSSGAGCGDGGGCGGGGCGGGCGGCGGCGG